MGKAAPWDSKTRLIGDTDKCLCTTYYFSLRMTESGDSLFRYTFKTRSDGSDHPMSAGSRPVTMNARTHAQGITILDNW